MQFQKDQSGKAVGAGRAIVQACAHDRLGERGSGGPGLGTPDFLFSLCSALIFSAGFPVLPVFLQVFQFVRPPLQESTEWGALGCTPSLRHDN